jgi:signal transduction histidine kinase
MTGSPAAAVVSSWASPAVVLPPDMVRAAVDDLRIQVRTDQIASWVAGTIVAVLGVVVGEYWAVVLGALVVVMAGVRLLARPALERSDLTTAVVWNAVGTWGVAIGVVALVPIALPIMVLNLVGPLITAAIYLDAGATRRFTIAGVGVALALGLIGFRTDGVGLGDGAPSWLFELVMIAYLAAHVVLVITLVGASNRARLDTLERAVAANAELRRSRDRVVAAADAERVRIERNIHDGAQQRLVALAVQLKLAAQLSRAGTPVDPDHVDDLHVQTREAIDELRELARGIYPSLLAERGLADALRGLAERAQQRVTIGCHDGLGLAPAAEAAVYFICTEALQNVAKHAGADATATVEIRRAGDVVSVTIRDDGRGFDAAAAAGSRGVLNMRDRVGALGGELVIDSRPGAGSTLIATVPVGLASSVLAEPIADAEVRT